MRIVLGGWRAVLAFAFFFPEDGVVDEGVDGRPGGGGGVAVEFADDFQCFGNFFDVFGFGKELVYFLKKGIFDLCRA